LATRYVIVERERVDSTQDVAAAELARRGLPVLVVAGRQTRGRGRTGRPWWEADRGLYTSLAFTPRWPPAEWGLVPLVAGLAARAAVATVLGVELDLRWPNDLLQEGRKVGGILAEGAPGRVVVGWGLDLWWREPPPGIAAILPEDPGPEVGRELAATWADGLLDRCARPAAAWERDAYRAACVTIGAAVAWDGGAGTAVDVAPDGALVVACAGGPRTVRAGEVRLRRDATLPGGDDTREAR